MRILWCILKELELVVKAKKGSVELYPYTKISTEEASLVVVETLNEYQARKRILQEKAWTAAKKSKGSFEDWYRLQQ